MKSLPLFICRANVWRSQIAEGIYNHRYGLWSTISCAGWEARKEKYNGKPPEQVISLAKREGGIDISDQRIKYLSDISDTTIARVSSVIFLFDPTVQTTCEFACKKDRLTPYEFFKDKNILVSIHPVPDPHEEQLDTWWAIYKSIHTIVEKL